MKPTQPKAVEAFSNLQRAPQEALMEMPTALPLWGLGGLGAGGADLGLT